MKVRAGQGFRSPQAIEQIAFTLVTGLIFMGISLLSHKAIHQRPIEFHQKVWLALIGLFAIASIISPNDDIANSFYRLGEWCLAYALIVSIYTREPDGNKAIAVDLIGKICWVTISIVLAVLLVAPQTALAAEAEFNPGTFQTRLGGVLYSASSFGTLTAIAAWYCILFQRGIRRVVFTNIAVVSMVLSYARGAWIGFIVAGVLYLMLNAGIVKRVVAVFGGIGSVVILQLYSDKVLQFVSRGRGQTNLETFSGRTAIWAAAIRGIAQRPLIGYGYIDGVKPALARYFKEFALGSCHNEFLQAALSGGLVCAALLLLIYVWGFTGLFRGVRNNRKDDYSLFLFLTFIQLAAFALITPVLTKPLNSLGVMLLICFLTAFDSPRWMQDRH